MAGQNASSKNLIESSVSQDVLRNQAIFGKMIQNVSVNKNNPPKVTRLSIIKNSTYESLEGMTLDELKNPSFVEGEVLFNVNSTFDLENGLREKSDKFKKLDSLIPAQIAMILAYSYPIVKIAGADMSIDSSQDMIAVYQSSGENAGLYCTSDVDIRELIRSYNFGINSRDVNEVINVLIELLPRKSVCTLPNMVAVNNGIFNYDTKELLPFSPDYIFTAKSRVNYNPNAKNVVIHNDSDGTDWDVESWMSDLSDDPEIPKVLWQILGAIIRPLVPWDKSAWFYSEQGNNGKGTLCELMRLLCGTGSYASISLSEFSKDFMLEPLTRVTAIIVDENDVGTYIDKAANLKAVITNDVIQINRKFKTPIAYRFHGFMVQCLNEMPKMKDRSNSFFRRQLFIPFDKCFTGKERKYIKHDYLHRTEVLEYVLYRVLNMDYYELNTPDRCVLALDELKEVNDPVVQFMHELTDLYPNGSGFTSFDRIPCKLLFDMFHNWYESNNKTRSSLRSNTFNKQIEDWVNSHSDEWVFVKGSTRLRTMHDMNMSVFKDFPAGNDWLRYENNEPVYSPSAEFSKNYISYIGFKKSIDVEMEEIENSLTEAVKNDDLYATYLSLNKSSDEIKDYMDSVDGQMSNQASFTYGMSFEDWLFRNKYPITDERVVISDKQVRLNEYAKEKKD